MFVLHVVVQACFVDPMTPPMLRGFKQELSTSEAGTQSALPLSFADARFNFTSNTTLNTRPRSRI
jgi:hypothetical protein